MKRAILFDLDDTLVPEFPGYESAAVAAYASLLGPPADASSLWTTLRAAARELWHASPVYEFCQSVQFGASTALFSDFPGDRAELRYLREWAPTYRREAWAGALRMLGVERDDIALQLAEAYRTCWPDHCRAYDDAVPMLRSLGDRYVVAVITNGPTDVQRAKLRHSGLDVFFPTVVISGECGFAKPHQRAFAAALAGLGTTGRDTVMIGDHAERDVAGARQAGMDAIWLNRHAATRPEGLDGVVEIGSLSDLRSALLDL